MAFHRLNAEPLPQPLPIYCQLDPRGNIHWQFNKNTMICIAEYAYENVVCKRNGGHFVQPAMGKQECSGGFPHNRPVKRKLLFSLMVVWTNYSTNNRVAYVWDAMTPMWRQFNDARILYTSLTVRYHSILFRKLRCWLVTFQTLISIWGLHTQIPWCICMSWAPNKRSFTLCSKIYTTKNMSRYRRHWDDLAI